MQLTEQDKDLIRRTMLEGEGYKATPEEAETFFRQVERTGLDPFNKQIYALFRYDNKKRRKAMQIQTSIDGLRLVAERTGKYGGGTPEQWCGPDGQWVDVWLSQEPPAAARAGVYKQGYQAPTFAVATLDEYAQRNRDGSLAQMWKQMPARMLLKCAESLALRKAFPQELSGLYTADEMGQADNGREEVPPAAPVEAPSFDGPALGGVRSPEAPGGQGAQTETSPEQSEKVPAPAEEIDKIKARIEALPGTWRARIDEAIKAAKLHSPRGKLVEKRELPKFDAILTDFESRWQRTKKIHAKAKEVTDGEQSAAVAIIEHATDGRTNSLRECTNEELDKVLDLMDGLSEGAFLLVPNEQADAFTITPTKKARKVK